MDDPNITIEEYIRLEEEKAQRHGRTFNWQTATYGKMEYSLSCEPTVSPLNEIDFRISFYESDDEDYMVIFDENSFSYKVIYVDNLKMGSENENDKVNMPSSPEPTISHSDDLEFFKDFENKFPAITYNDDLTSKLTEPSVEGYTEDIVHNYEQRLETIWGRSVNCVHVLDFAGLIEGMRQTLGDRLRMIYTGDEGHELFTSHAWRRLFEIKAPLLGEVRRRMTWRQFILALGLHTATEMAEVVRGHFIGHLAAHFGLVGDEGLKGLLVITHELSMIDLHELVRLNICVRLGDTWAWVAPGPERQQVATAGAPKAAEDAPADVEGVPAAPAPVTISQRLARLDEDVYGIQVCLGEHRKVVDTMARDFSRFTVWAAGGISQLLDLAGATYTWYSETHVPYQRRRVRRKTGDASTTTAQLIFTYVYYDMMAFDLFVNDRIKTGRPCCEEIDDMVYSEIDVC
ncbi:hypothetical protein Tco_1110789 [Tanacetum coccineum]|uniref:Uncharacterized protein n=1 Tax=Tanacetum coccineum TaxID=301880 RepID=A0ABQ5IK88_9ASTR